MAQAVRCEAGREFRRTPCTENGCAITLLQDGGYEMKVEGRVALVTGASGGIGGALVQSLLNAGVRRVVACDLEGEGLTRIQRSSPEQVTAYPLDVTDEIAVAAAAEAFPGVDILINCHGVAVQQSYLEATSLTAFR